MLIPKFAGEVHRGTVELYDKETYRDYVRTLEGKRITLSLKKFTNPRSTQENKYYWGVIVDTLANEFGILEKEEMHEILKNKFLKERLMVVTGKGTIEAVEFVRSTTGLSVVEFEDYLSKIRTWASLEHQTYLPLPNEIDLSNFTYY